MEIIIVWKILNQFKNNLISKSKIIGSFSFPDNSDRMNPKMDETGLHIS